MFLRRKKKASGVPGFDRTGKLPALRSSICTGEQVAGFKDEKTGKFTEVMLIRSEADLEEFLEQYGFSAEELVQVW